MNGDDMLSNQYSSLDKNNKQDRDPRESFKALLVKSGREYHTRVHTCKKATCIYTIKNLRMIFFENHNDNELYTFYYNDDDNRSVNKLINAKIIKNMNKMYNLNLQTNILENDNNNLYIKVENASQDSKGKQSYGYKRVKDNTYLTKDNIEVPNEYIVDDIIQLPTNGTLKTTNIFVDGQIGLFDSYSDLLKYTNAPNDIEISLSNGKTMKHIVDEYDNIDYWIDIFEDGTVSLENAKVIIAKNRENFPDINNNIDLILTSQLGNTEDLNNQDKYDISDYSDNGKQLFKWYYIDQDIIETSSPSSYDNSWGSMNRYSYKTIHNLTDAIDVKNSVEAYHLANKDDVHILRLINKVGTNLLYKMNEEYRNKNYNYGRGGRLNVWKKSQKEYLGMRYTKGFLPKIYLVEYTEYFTKTDDLYSHFAYYVKPGDNRIWCAVREWRKDWINYYWDESQTGKIKWKLDEKDK
jgi:hypothetical protein